MKYVEAYCNISGDENRDYLNHTEIEYNFDLALSESDKNGYITNITIFDTNYEFEDLIIDDIDADGDNDIVFGYSGGYVQVYENLGNGSFNPDWDKGIPDKIKNPLLPNLFTRQIKVGDINNDGYLDICTAMRAGSWDGQFSYALYYNWLSLGNGTWIDYSNDFPIGERVLYIDIADIDNDGDLDYGILTDSNGYIYENLDGHDWEVRSFPNFNSQISDFIFNDIDLDGYIDILTIETNYFPTNETWISKVNISFGKGNFLWYNTNQFTSINKTYERPYIDDFDKDGDKDLIFLSHSYVYYSENVIFHRRNMSFTKTPTTTHFRSGYLTQFAWTMKDGYKICNNTKNIEFNLSISYTGPEGPFFHLKNVKGRWWTDVIIPDISSNDVYFRINYSSYSALSGPYTIHGSDGLCSFVEMTDPGYGSYLMEGENVNVTFRTSENLPSGTYPVYLVNGGNRTLLGSYRFTSNLNNSVSLKIPWGTNSSYCHFEVTIDWHGHRRDIDTASRFNVVLMVSVPDRYGNIVHTVPAGYKTGISVPVLSLNGSDISSSCGYEILNLSAGISVKVLGDGTVNVTCPDVGDYFFRLRASRYSWSVEDNITLRSVPPLDSVLLTTQDNDPRVGKPMDVLVRGLDPGGGVISLDGSCVEWIIEGDCEYSSIAGGVRIVPLSAGIIRVRAVVDVGLGPVEGRLDVSVGSTLTGIRFISLRDEMMNGTSQTVEIAPLTYNHGEIDGYDVEWTLGSNGAMYSVSRDSIEITATGEGPLDVSVRIIYHNESVHVSRVIDVLPAPGDVRLDRSMVVEVGNTSEYTIEIQASSGGPYTGAYEMGFVVKDPSMATASISENVLMVHGEREGKTEIILNLSTDEGVFVKRSFPVEVRSTPVSIHVVSIPDTVQVGDVVEFDVSITNHQGDIVDGFEMDIVSANCDVRVVNDTHVTLIPLHPGRDDIVLKVSKYDTVIDYSFALDIVPNAVELAIHADRAEIPVGVEFAVSVTLLDNEGERIDWTEYHIDTPESIGVMRDEGGSFILNISDAGSYDIRIWVDYHGEILERSLKLTAYEPSVLSDVLIRKNGDLVEVLCIDQFGENITDRCSIRWIGEFDIVEPFKVIGRSGTLSVNVTYNGTSMERKIKFGSGEDVHGGLNPLLLIIPLSVLLLSVSSVLFYLFVLKRRGNDTSLDPGFGDEPTEN